MGQWVDWAKESGEVGRQVPNGGMAIGDQAGHTSDLPWLLGWSLWTLGDDRVTQDHVWTLPQLLLALGCALHMEVLVASWWRMAGEDLDSGDGWRHDKAHLGIRRVPIMASS